MRRLLLLAILAGSVLLWRPAGGELHIAGDDRLMMAASREIVLHGRWERLVEPQDVHVVPLFRLLRLYFDLHFPGQFHWMHRLALAAHLASTALLYALSARSFRSPWGPSTAALLFGWGTLGAEAIIIPSQNTFVLGLAFILGGLYCLCRLGEGGRRLWALGASLYLAAAVGVHSLGAALTIPGVLLGDHLLARSDASRREAWAACAGAFLLGAAAWLRWCLPTWAGYRAMFHGGPPTLQGLLARLWDGAQGVVLHFGFLIRHGEPSKVVVGLGLVAFAGLFLMLRNPESRRWLATALALTVVPLFAVLAVRGSAAYPHSRYCYQSFLLVAVAAGSAVERAWTAIPSRPALRAVFLAALAVIAGGYYLNQRRLLGEKVRLLRFAPSVTREFWVSWANFFEQAAARARLAGAELRLPSLQADPTLRTDEIFAICNPRGKPGIVALTPPETRAQDCASFHEPLPGGRALPCYAGAER